MYFLEAITQRNQDHVSEVYLLSQLAQAYKSQGQYQPQLAIARNKGEQLQTGVALNTYNNCSLHQSHPITYGSTSTN